MINSLVLFILVSPFPSRASFAELSPFVQLTQDCPEKEEDLAELIAKEGWPEIEQKDFNKLWKASVDHFLKTKDACLSASFVRHAAQLADRNYPRAIIGAEDRLRREFMSNHMLCLGLILLAWKQKLRPPDDATDIEYIMAFDKWVTEETVARLSLPSPFPAMNWVGASRSDEWVGPVFRRWSSAKQPGHFARETASYLIARFPRDPGEARTFLDTVLKERDLRPPKEALEALDYYLVNGVPARRVKKLSPPIFDRIMELE